MITSAEQLIERLGDADRDALAPAVDRRFGVGPTEERIVACCTAQLQAEIAGMYRG